MPALRNTDHDLGAGDRLWLDREIDISVVDKVVVDRIWTGQRVIYGP